MLGFTTTIMLEIGFWGIIGGCIIIFRRAFKSLCGREKSIFAGLIVTAVILRIKFGLFVPWHQHDHYVQMMGDMLANYNYHGFFRIPYIYNASSGLSELFVQRFLLLFGQFSVYHVSLISLAVSMASGIVLFYFARIVTGNTDIGLLSLAIYSFFPVQIKISAAYTLFLLNSLAFLLFLCFAVLAVRERSPTNYLFLFATFTGMVYCRRDIAVFFLGSVALLALYYLVRRYGDFRNVLLRRQTLILLLLMAAVTVVFVYTAVLPNIDVGIRDMGARSPGHYKHFILFLNPLNFVDYSAETYYAYFHLFFSPLYFYPLFMFALALVIVRKREYLPVTALTLYFMLTFIIFFTPVFSDVFRSVLIILPLIILQAALAMHYLLARLKLTRRAILITGFAVVGLSIFQNTEFLTIVPARRIEQDFIGQNLTNLPENSLLLTIAEKKYQRSEFFQYDRNYAVQTHGMEFPRYLLGNRNIHIMDIYREYDRDTVGQYENVYYYRGLYAYHETAGPLATGMFERDHELVPINEQEVVNYGYDSHSVAQFLSGNNNTVNSGGSRPVLGLYRVADRSGGSHSR